MVIAFAPITTKKKAQARNFSTSITRKKSASNKKLQPLAKRANELVQMFLIIGNLYCSGISWPPNEPPPQYQPAANAAAPAKIRPMTLSQLDFLARNNSPARTPNSAVATDGMVESSPSLSPSP